MPNDEETPERKCKKEALLRSLRESIWESSKAILNEIALKVVPNMTVCHKE